MWTTIDFAGLFASLGMAAVLLVRTLCWLANGGLDWLFIPEFTSDEEMAAADPDGAWLEEFAKKRDAA